MNKQGPVQEEDMIQETEARWGARTGPARVAGTSGDQEVQDSVVWDHESVVWDHGCQSED